MTDTDDSIVLDDLVRTGEASRLRRRGAMRLDHHHHQSHPAIISWDYDDDDDDDDDDDEGEDIVPPGLHYIRAHPRAAAEYKYSLFCGGDVPSPAETDAFTPSILPLGLSLPPPSKQRLTNGCGTLLHSAAAPRRRASSAVHAWHALPGAGASPALVPLDPAYIDDATALHIHRAPCGCIRDALACAVCGNLLGTRFAPCPIDAHSPAPHSYSYTFLPAAVSSAPAYSPSPPSPRAATPPPLLDRFITASPTPLTDEERTAYSRVRSPWGSGIGYTYAQMRSSLRYPGAGASAATPSESAHDPDAGDADVDEAASDKAGEGVFLPER